MAEDLDTNRPGQGDGEALDVLTGDAYYLQLARHAYTSTTDWLNTNVRNNWERNLAHFHNRHAPGSKFNLPSYRGRSKVFRPKTRSAMRSAEAAFAAAMFSTAELIDISAEDKDNEVAVASARINQALLQYRLTKSIPWFMTAMGAFQDGNIYGVTASHQYWDFKEIKYQVPVMDQGVRALNEDGTEATETRTRVVHDRPCVDLLPPENVRLDSAADWRDPVNSSPYVVRLVPMYVDDVLDCMQQPKVCGQKWRTLTKQQLLSAKTEDYDSTRSARNNQRTDPHQNKTPSDHSTVWLHQNFVRIDGEEYVFWTVGTEFMLADPVPLHEAYFHGKRPIVIGYVVLESHRTYPSAPVDLTSGLQEASNELANQRFDNVQLVLNKRYFLRRGQQVDLDSLTRNVPGGGVMVDDPEKDVRIVSTPDVTQSSYEEQDRIDVQLDELAGNFSQSSVSQNANLNKTLGGLQLVSSGAGAVSEYTIRTFVETWVEPVLRQLMLLEQYYETDPVVLALVGREAAQLMQKFGMDQVTDDLLIQELNLTVNVGIGATNPQQKVERFLYGLNAVAQVPRVAARIKADPVIQEVFGALGYKTGARFFLTEEEAQGIQDPMAEVERQKAANEAKALEIDEARARNDHEYRMAEIDRRQNEASARLFQERELRYAELASREGLTIQQILAKVRAEEGRNAIAAMKDKTTRQTVALRETVRQNEMALKTRMGSGI